MHPKHIGHLEFSPAELLIAVDVVVAAAYTFWPSTRSRMQWSAVCGTPFLWPAVLLVLAAAASTLLAADRHHALQWYRQTVLEPIAFYTLLLVVRASAAIRLLRLWALLGAGAGAGAVGLVQWLTGRGLAETPGTNVKLVQSVYTSADNLGLLFDRVIPVWFALAVRRARTRAATMWFALGALYLVALYLSRSRGAEAGVLGGTLLVVALLYGRGRGFRLGMLLLAVALVGTATLGGEKIVHAVNAGHANTVTERFYVWQSAEHMLESHPVFGIGPDNFLHYYAPRRGARGWSPWLPCPSGLGYLNAAQVSLDQPCLSHPHDEVLDFWLSAGLAGLVAFLWLEWVFWREAWAAFRTAAVVPRYLVAGVMGAMAAGLIHGLVDNSYFLPDLSVFFWLLCASIQRSRAGEKDAPPYVWAAG